jgi:uncharacterized DUF497 family protein
MNFEWDPDKNKANIAKHGISFDIAKEVFDDKNAFDFDDVDHSDPGQQRYQMYGRLKNGKVYMVVFTEPEEGTLRIITAFTSKDIERIYYEGQELI